MSAPVPDPVVAKSSAPAAPPPPWKPLPPGAREVIGVDGQIAVLGPDDKLVVRCPAGMTQDVIEQVGRTLGDVFGSGRIAVFSHDFEIAVQRGDSDER